MPVLIVQTDRQTPPAAMRPGHERQIQNSGPVGWTQRDAKNRTRY